MRNYMKAGVLCMALLALSSVAFFPAALDDGADGTYAVGDTITLEVLATESVKGVTSGSVDICFQPDAVAFNDDGRWLIEGLALDDLGDVVDNGDGTCSVLGVFAREGPQDISEGQRIASLSFSCVGPGAGELSIIVVLSNGERNGQVSSFEYVIVDGPEESSKVLVTIGQDGQSVCVVMYALDGKVIPSGTFKLKANYTYINEFGDLVSENQSIKLAYESDGSPCAMVSDNSFVNKLEPEEYGHVFCITGTYQLGPLSGSVSKTAYSPVKA